jgi:DNA-binding GntR family transcriptional regulator
MSPRTSDAMHLLPEPAERQLGAQAHDAIRRLILTARLPPGAQVSEQRLSDLTGFGRAPVRAGLARLSQEGLVQAVARRGYTVTPVTVHDIHEVFELRLILEPAAVAMAAGRIDAAALSRLDAICTADYRPDDPDSALAFLDANTAFHVAVAAFGGNQRLARQLGRLLDEMTRMLLLGLVLRDRTPEMRAEHRRLIDALAAGDGATAAALSRAEIVAARAMVTAGLTGRGSRAAIA